MVNRMLSVFVAGAVMIGSAQVSFARLGETEAELEARYGKPLQTDVKPKDVPGAEKRLHFSKKGINVTVYTFRGRSGREDYGFTDGSGNPSPVRANIAKAEALLEASAGDAQWQATAVPPLFDGVIELLWARSDGRAKANVFVAKPDVMRVIDQAFIDESNRSDTQESIGLGGF